MVSITTALPVPDLCNQSADSKTLGPLVVVTHAQALVRMRVFDARTTSLYTPGEFRHSSTTRGGVGACRMLSVLPGSRSGVGQNTGQ